MTPNLETIKELARKEDWLAILVTSGKAGRPSVSLVNFGVINHPVGGHEVLALVSRGMTAKLRNLRADPRASLVVRSGWDWVSVTGTSELVGPDDPHDLIPQEEVPRLLRSIYSAAGGTHPDLAEYDREMRADRRAAILITPERFVSNPTPHDREDD
jgi:PPOX class probable F420-dependent enzyme